MRQGKRRQKEPLTDDQSRACNRRRAETEGRKDAAKLGMAELVDHMRLVLEIASHTADHAELREVIAVLEVLRDEGIKDLEGLKDYIFDYELANRQIDAMREKYEKPEAVIKEFGIFACPKCNNRVYHWMKHCGKCGQAITTS